MPENSPLVSVISPAWNCEKTLKNTLESVFAQTYRPFECILIDDGSTDTTATVAKSFPELNYHYQKNAGAAAARNAGIQIAKGEFIAFLDADDFWHRDKLAILIEAFSELPESYVLVYNLRCPADPEKNSFGTTSNLSFDSSKILPKTITDLLYDPYLGIPCVMVKKEALVRINGFNDDLETAEDIDLYLRLLESQDFALYQEELTAVGNTEGSLGKRLISYRDNLQVIQAFETRCPDIAHQNQSAITKLVHKIHNKWLNELLFTGKGGEARQLIRQMQQQNIPVDRKGSWFLSFLAPIKAKVRSLTA